MEVLSKMMVHIFYLLTARSLTRSAFSMNPFSNKWVVVGVAVTVAIQIIIVYALPHIGINPFRTEAFPAQWWVLIVSLGFLGFFLVELGEFVVERVNRAVRKG